MENFKIKMKKTSRLTNPAKNSVLQVASDSLLSCYLQELASCQTLSMA